MNTETVYRVGDVKKIVGLSKNTIYRQIKKGNFPKPIRIGTRAVAWRSSDIQNWIETRETTM